MTSNETSRTEKVDTKTPERSIPELEAEISLARIELVDTVNALADRVKPKNLAAHASATTKTAAQDAANAIAGGGMPVDYRQARNAKIFLGASAALILGIGVVILRKSR